MQTDTGVSVWFITGPKTMAWYQNRTERADHMSTYADLEIALQRRDAGEYAVELRFSDPNHSDADEWKSVDDPPPVRIDAAQLREYELDPPGYGLCLGEGLLSDERVREVFDKARAITESSEQTLRLRLFIGPTAPELHAVRWETLRDPRDGLSLVTNENVLFSRYLSSADWRAVRPRPRGDLRTLVMIANPSDSAAYNLAPIVVADELARVHAALAGLADNARADTITELASGGHATLDNLRAHLRAGYDIVYLICHGKFVDRQEDGRAKREEGLSRGKPVLYLEDADGRVKPVPGRDLIIALRELQQRPRLLVLASCQSAGTGTVADATSTDGGVLAALGPRLAELGIPAVLAMQGSVTMTTMDQFMTVFWRELQRDGQIDQAMAAARAAVRDRSDAWMPVLFLRLRTGRLWSNPGFKGDKNEFQKWDSLSKDILDGKCTPILGPGLVETIIGSFYEIARQWAITSHFPMELDDRAALPQVAQFLAINQSGRFPVRRLLESVCVAIQGRHHADLTPELRDLSLKERSQEELITIFDAMIALVGERRQERNPADPYRVLAQLPFSIYLTTNADSLLFNALKHVRKAPTIALCPWNEYVEHASAVRGIRASHGGKAASRLDRTHPLVYHLFGRLDDWESVVLTEDNHFDYLIGVTKNKDLIPAEVRAGLADSALLFLGFQMDDWSFRVPFRSVMDQQGGGKRKNYAHVAVQIDPEEGRIVDPESARRYLKDYFQGADISIFWGSVEDFFAQLLPRVGKLLEPWDIPSAGAGSGAAP